MQVSRRLVEILVSTITSIIGVAVIVDSVHLGIGWEHNSPEPGYFPFRVGVILVIASVGIAIQCEFAHASEVNDPFVIWSRFKSVLAVLLPTLLYVIGIATIGIYVSSALFIAGFMVVAGRFGWFTTATVSIGTALALFFLFEVGFLVPLPKGPLEALFNF